MESTTRSRARAATGSGVEVSAAVGVTGSDGWVGDGAAQPARSEPISRSPSSAGRTAGRLGIDGGVFGGRRVDLDGDGQRVGGGAIGIEEAGGEGVGAAQFAADVQGEFELPGHGFDHANRGDLAAVRVDEGDLEVRALLEGGHFDVHAQAAAIRVRERAEGGDLCLGGGHAVQVVFGEEKFHAGNYTQLRGAGYELQVTGLRVEGGFYGEAAALEDVGVNHSGLYILVAQ